MKNKRNNTSSESRKNQRRRNTLSADQMKHIKGGSWFVSTHKGQALSTWVWE